MDWLMLFSLLMQLALKVFNVIQRQQLLDQVRAEELNVLLKRTTELVRVARAARDAPLPPVVSDPNNRDTDE